MKPRHKKRPNRAGYALVLFLMMFFGLMGLAALVIDLGFARLAQRQMQTAVDSAALEGLRWRDASLTDPSAPNPRQQASQIVSNLFTDYPDPSTGTPVHYGAGPVLNFSGGIGPTELAASQSMQPGTPPVYQPGGLELNADNAQEGDMVAGTYGSNSAYNQQNPTPSADEDDYYSRRDFQNTSNQAFLVRMRRTANPNGIDSETGISSGGVIVNSDGTSSPATLPYLFGRGSVMARSTVSQGITLRATAIAAAGDSIQFGSTSYSAGRAKAAGQPFQQIDQNNPANTVNIPGITPFALSLNNWGSGQTSFQVASGGSITGGGQVAQPTLIEIGQQVGKSAMQQNAAWLSDYVTTNGTSPVNYTGPTLLALSQYVPVVDTNNTIIGFGYVQNWTWTGDATGGTLSFTKGPSGLQPVGYGNVSGTFVPGLTQDTTDFASLFQAHATFGNPLYAPVLVNHYIGPHQSNP